ncbi:Cholesterol side-chain cleavage enzyme, mitochondrial [Trichoplax sp. H2]|nr:Cholesterol side-chain cleavage enzyme, mitochondrial [Trichoplax sp. H2]|eukprot:RDD36151.1 Cholesterol side-chain cleavage enzyme, mitochondrial [Trichoplax sp. H2]
MLTRLAKIPLVPLNSSRPLLVNKVVFQSTTEITHESPKDNDNDYHKAKPFQEISKPDSLPLIGSLLMILKNNGYYQRNTHLYFSKLAQKYGPVFRDKIVPLSYLFVYKPEDVAKVFQAEGKYPASWFNVTVVDLQETTKESERPSTRVSLE